MKKLLFIILCLFGTNSNAETKQLICDFVDEVGLKVARYEWSSNVRTHVLPVGIQAGIEKNLCDNYSISCERANEMLLKIEVCRNKEFLVRYKFTIDDSDLNTANISNAEFSSDTCGGQEYGIQMVKMISTPSYISFNGAHSLKTAFNIDRKTLKAGYSTNRLFNCKVIKILTKNKI